MPSWICLCCARKGRPTTYQTIHHNPIVGGWTQRVPAGAFALTDGNPLLAPWSGHSQPGAALDGALAALYEANVRYMAVRKQQIASVPEEMRFLLATLRPVYQDRSILVLPVQAESAPRPVPQSSATVCWTLDGPEEPADGVQVAMIGPNGFPLFEGTASLPVSSPGLSCQFWPLELNVPFGANLHAGDACFAAA
jgi:hypothetical protein